MEQLPLLESISPPPPTFTAFAVPDLMSEKIPFHAVEALLEQYLQEELDQFEPLGVKALPFRDINCKWRFSSACQKSIRRGYVEDSVRYALTYHAIDSTGFWTRLVAVAFEDIGVGDVWVVASTLAIARSKVFRQKIGGDVACIQYIITKLAEAVKDRTVCDFFQVLENRSIVPTILTTLMSATPQGLSEIALSDQHRFDTRLAAAWMLWGTGRLKNDRLPLRTGNRELFEYTIERLNVPGIVKYICLRGMVACRWAMNIAYPFVWLMMQQSPYRRIIEMELSEPSERLFINGLPDFAFDQHTREGKAAYKYFYQSCPSVNDFLTSRGIVGNDEILSAIGIAVFIGESALLDRWLDFEGAKEIYLMTVEDDYKKNSLTLGDGRELAKLIETNADILREARISVVGGRRL